MIPLRLTLEGLYSYRERQTIDFSRLTESHLFGIFGATGSGKSSILEAISFALYGDSDRLSKGDRRNYNMMNLRANQLFISFEFDAEGVIYRFEVQGKRNSRRHEDVGTLERRAYRQQNDGQWEPLKEASAEPIIGLTYENFCRTIIIPQGKFQAFLELTETARTRMLADLFNLDRFEMAEKVAGLDKRNQSLLTANEAQIGQFEDTTQEAMQALREQLFLLKTALEKEKAQVKSWQQAVAKADIARQKQLNYERLSADKAALELLIPDMVRREAKLEAYETCLRDFKPLFDQRAELVNRIEHISRDKAARQQLLQEGERQFAETQKVFAAIEKQYLQRDRLLQEAEEYELANELRKKEETLQALQLRSTNGEVKIAEKKEAIAQRKSTIEDHVNRVKAMRAVLPDAQELSAVKGWFDQLKLLTREQELCEQEANRITQELEEKINLREISLRHAGVPPFQTGLEGGVMLQTVEKMTLGAKDAATEAEKAAEQAMLLDHLGTLADHLRPGDPCPLCGATDHPAAATSQGVRTTQNALLTAREEARETHSRLAQILTQLREWLEQEKKMELRRLDWEQRLVAAHQAVQKHRTAFVWAAFSPSDAEKVEQQFRALATQQQEIQRLETAAEEGRKHFETENLELQKFQEALQKIREDYTRLESAIQTEVRRFRIMTQEALAVLTSAQLEKNALDKRTAHADTEKSFVTVQQRLRSSENSNNELKGTIAQLETNLKEATRDFDLLRLTIESEIAQSGFENMEAIRQILSAAVDVVSEKKAIEAFRVKEKALMLQWTQAGEEARATPFDAQEFEAWKSQLAAAEIAVTEKERETGGAQETLTRMESRWEEKKQFLAINKQLKIRAENLKTMKRLFAASGFVNYVSTMFLDQLCLAANDRFRRLTRNTLEIRTGNNNSLQVCDWLNGGKERSVKTLSGGQSFQAALSLALALADQVQYQARAKQNFFFLDEGFGSQDKNSLAVVMETLKSLRKENRVVGVISHVEEMQQELSAHIHISLDPERGSVVTTSWE